MCLNEHLFIIRNMSKKNLELLESLKKQVEGLPHRDSGNLDALKQRTKMLISKIFGNSSDYNFTLTRIRFSPMVVISGSGASPYDNAWRNGHKSFLNLVNTMIEDVSLTIEPDDITANKIVAKTIDINLEKIFLVHGHSEEMKQSAARTIEKLGLYPIILHEQPNKGRTIIQKFIDHSNVGFAVVLMSADDYGYSKSESPKSAKFRARQNVILELGFFLGKLGSERVLALFEPTDNFDLPSDYDGVLFIPFDPDGRWQFDLAKELKELDYKVDANALL